MKLLRILRSLFPAPRTPWRWGALWPLVTFLVVYGGTIGALQAYDIVLFSRPTAFALLLVTPWVWWLSVHGWSGLSRARSVQALFVRLLLIGVFVALLAEPRSVRTTDKLSVVYAIDISESIHQSQVTEALRFVARTVSRKPEGDEAGLIVFGSSAAVELPPREAFPLDENDPDVGIALNTRVDRDATNLEQGLSLGAALLPDQTRGRIVLVSDGSETSGDLQATLKELQARGIAVDVLPITYSYENEVWIERLDLPQFVKLGEPYEASAVISSLKPGKGKLILEENGEPIAEPFEIEFQAGKNRIDIPIYLRTPGYYEYRARLDVDPDQDGRFENNEAMGYIYVEGEGKTLIVVDPLREDDRDFEVLAQAIRQSERVVEIVEAYEFARDPLSLLPYDCVIFANVPHDAFDSVQLQALHDAVYNQGTGFLMVGGANSFGPGGYHRTVVEDALPVTMDITKKKIMPKGALAIILHTCEFPEGNTWAKRITKQAIKVLGREDEVGVIAYGPGGEQWIFELMPAGEYESMVPKINAAAIGDMPAFGPTMELGLEGLENSDAATKHMIIISDGDPQPAPQQILNGFLKSKISISTVAIFPHGGTEIGLLRAIANVTGGRYYFPADPNELPSIFIKEAKTLKRSMIQEKTISANIGYPSGIVKGVDAMPLLHGYVLTSLKENALVENVLYTVTEEAGETEDDPLLAVWRYGLGSTAAFTSGLSNQWAREWVDWNQYQVFVKQLLTRISRVRKAGHLKMWTYHSGGEGVIMVEDFHPDEMFLDLTATVSGPGGQERTVPLKQVGPRRYQGTFPVVDKGRYQVIANGSAGERKDRVVGGFIVSYSPEFLRFTSNWNVLRDVKDATGGEELSADSPPEEIYNRRVPKVSSQPIFDWFLVALACLIPIDVAIRRVQIDWVTVKEMLGLKKSPKSSERMGALLARKEAVSAQLRGTPEERPLAAAGSKAAYQTTSKTPERVAAKKPRQPTAGDQQKTQEKPETTTSRLLELKRKRQEGS